MFTYYDIFWPLSVLTSKRRHFILSYNIRPNVQWACPNLRLRPNVIIWQSAHLYCQWLNNCTYSKMNCINKPNFKLFTKADRPISSWYIMLAECGGSVCSTAWYFPVHPVFIDSCFLNTCQSLLSNMYKITDVALPLHKYFIKWTESVHKCIAYTNTRRCDQHYKPAKH